MPFIHPDKIIIPAGRYRTDFNSVQSRADDIKRTGQLVPILCRRDDQGSLILVDGECRTRACKLLDREVWYTTNEDGKVLIDSEFHHRRAEIMCNIGRDDMTPVDRSRAIADLDRLMKEEFGQSGQNAIRDDGKEGHSTADTASMLGYKTRKTVNDAILIAKAAEDMPELADAKTMAEATKMIQVKARLNIQQELARRRAAEPQTGTIQDLNKHFSDRLILGDCLEGMKQLQPGIASIFLTDPPFGVNLDEYNKLDCKVSKGGLSRKIMGTYSDKPDEIIELLDNIIEQMARVGRPDCFVYMFCAAINWNYFRETFIKNGFNVYHSPMYWIRGDLELGRIHPGSRCTVPEKWPMKCVWPILFASRGSAVLAKQGQPDCVVCDPSVPGNKIHSLQLPIPLLTELISRVFHPGTKGLLVDPFAGSGSSLAAAMRFDGLSYLGYELDPANRERAIAYLINEYHRMQQPEDELGDMEV